MPLVPPSSAICLALGALLLSIPTATSQTAAPSTQAPLPEPLPTESATQPQTKLAEDPAEDGALIAPFPPKQEQPPAPKPPVEETPPPIAPPARYPSFRGDPLARTSLQQAQTQAEFFQNGIAGVPNVRNAPLLSAPSTSPDGIHLDPVVLHPSLSLGAEFISEDSDDSLHALVLGSTSLSLGSPNTPTQLDIDYTASLRQPPGPNSSRPLDQQLALRGLYRFTRLQLGLAIQYSSLNGPDRDAGKSTERDFLSLALTSNYQFSGKTSAQWDLVLPIRRSAGGLNSAGVTNIGSLNYSYTPKTQLALGAAFGFLSLDNSHNQSFQQAFARAEYLPHQKLRGQLTLGVQFLDAGKIQQTTPLFNLALIWNPKPSSSFVLAAEQRTVNSDSDTGTNFLSSSLALSYQQKLGRRLSLNATLGYEHADYKSLKPNLQTNRQDDYLIGQLGLTFATSRRWTTSLISSSDHTDSDFSHSRRFQITLLHSFLF